VVRDLTDINHPRTISNLGNIPAPQFVSATELSYAVDSSLYRVPLSGSPKSLVTSQGGAGSWNPDGSAVVYTTAVSPETTTVHQFKSGRDQVLGTVPGGGGGGCESVAGCAIANLLDFRLLYSPDGTHISLVTTGFSGSSFRVWSSDGTLLKSSDAYGPTMSVWSGASLYFRDLKGVEVWRDGVVSPFLPGVVWIKPHGSSAGGQVVYTARDSSGWGHIYVVDTTTRQVRELKSHRSNAVFLTSRYIWYQGERDCVPADACGATPPWHPGSGKAYIYDLQDGTETESVITSVADVWPHVA
jgi:Tol biopolymer transport system component